MKFVVENAEHVKHNPVFSYLEPAEKTDIEAKILDQKSLVISVYDDEGKHHVSCVIEFYDDCLHVREIAGKQIVKYIGGVEAFCVALCKRYKKKFLSFCSAKDGIKWIGQKMGYHETIEGEFVKAVN